MVGCDNIWQCFKNENKYFFVTIKYFLIKIPTYKKNKLTFYSLKEFVNKKKRNKIKNVIEKKRIKNRKYQRKQKDKKKKMFK